MSKKVWIVIIAAAVLVLAAGTITAQNLLDGEANKQAEEMPDLSGSGVLLGRIDSHSVEIEVDGEPKVFGLSDALRDEEFAAGPISFKYYVDKNGCFILTELAASQTGEAELQTATGIFNGQVDSHTVEIRVGEEDRAYTFVEGIAVDALRPGDMVTFDYKEEQNGRLVIVRLEKSEKGDSGAPAGNEVICAEGVLIGRIDSHSVEIEVDGEPKAFGLSDTLRDEEFAAGPISFKYYVDKNGRAMITEAEWTREESGTIKTAEGVFNGLADSHTVEIEIDGQAMSFGLAAGISFAGIAEGEPVFIAYRETDGDRPVIIKVERLS